jgi:hypothetical protein
VNRFDNSGSADARQLCVITPAIMGPAYFREAAEVIGAAAGSPPDRTKMTGRVPTSWHDGGRPSCKIAADGDSNHTGQDTQKCRLPD